MKNAEGFKFMKDNGDKKSKNYGSGNKPQWKEQNNNNSNYHNHHYDNQTSGTTE